MQIQGAVALVTGANRGLGRHFTQQLLERGAAKVYATARRPELIDIPGVETLRLDITDPTSIAAVAEVATDVTLLVNNAGVSTGAKLVSGDLDQVRLELDTHFWGTLGLIRSFAPRLGEDEGKSGGRDSQRAVRAVLVQSGRDWGVRGSRRPPSGT